MFDEQTRFNWGYHDAASDVENSRTPLVDGVRFYGTTKEWAEARGPSPYVTGYVAGHKASKNGTYDNSSKSAWEMKDLS